MLLKNNELTMTEGYNAGRLSLFDSLMKKNLGVASGKLWTLEPKEMRFKLGETIAELKIPFHMGGEDEAVIEDADQSLLSLLTRRFETTGFEARGESAPQSVHPGAPNLKEKTYRTEIYTADALEKKLAEAIA